MTAPDDLEDFIVPNTGWWSDFDTSYLADEGTDNQREKNLTVSQEEKMKFMIFYDFARLYFDHWVSLSTLTFLKRAIGCFKGCF